jgi:hypothetical protein
MPKVHDLEDAVRSVYSIVDQVRSFEHELAHRLSGAAAGFLVNRMT